MTSDKSKKMTLDEILFNFAKTFAQEPVLKQGYGWYGHDTDLGDCKESFQEARFAILELFKSVVPEEMIHPLQEMPAGREYRNGHNSCRKEILERLEKL